MNSRKIVYDTLEGNSPKRIPRHLWVLPWAQYTYPDAAASLQSDFPNDIVICPPMLTKELKTSGNMHEPGIYIDEWGCVFHNLERGIMGEVKEPVISSWEQVKDLVIPHELLSVDIKNVNRFCRETDKFVIAGGLPRPFERLQWLRGTEQLFMDLILEPDQVRQLLSKVHALYLDQVEVWCRTDVDALWFMDDWGSQNSLLISPALWKDVLFPCYQEYIDTAHSYGKKVFCHSDGNILEVLPYMIDAGLDAVNSQIFCMDWEKLQSVCKGNITLWGEIDRQNLLPTGSKEEITEAVTSVYRTFYHNGYLIAQMEFGPAANPENIRTAFETWNQFPM